MDRDLDRRYGTRSSASGAASSMDDDAVLDHSPAAADVNLTPGEAAPVDAPDPREVGGGLAPGVQRRSGLGAEAGVDATVGYVDEGHQPIGMVREGMKVVDAAGDEIGHVDYVKMGDPQAAGISDAEVQGTNDLVDVVAEAFRGPSEIPVTIRERLLRLGFIHVDGKGWFDKDRYVPADAIAAVTADTVRLSATKDDLVEA
jgi:hypothetical protein